MAKLNHIKSLKTENANMFDLLVSFVFGKVNIDVYRPQKKYVKGDSIIKLNATTGLYEVLLCTAPTTGTYDSTKWKLNNVHESTSGDFIDTYTILSKTKPTDQFNRVWHQQVRTRGTIDPESFVVV
jgi:5-deoxy-D-glucuronate isomerase